jgi:hypothetical protein
MNGGIYLNEKSNYTPAQAREIGFNRNEYAPAAERFFTGTLVMKIYGAFCLRCYFETVNGEKLKLTAWQNRRTGRYVPNACLIDFKEVPLKTKWEIVVSKNRIGRLTWAVIKEVAETGCGA